MAQNPITYVIQRSTEWGLRAQIMAALNSISVRVKDYWPYGKNSVAADESLTIPAGYQLIVHKSFDVEGSVDIEGELVIL